MIKGINHITIAVSDLERSIDFIKTLGYDIECSDDEGITKWLTIFKPSEIKLELV